MRQNGPRAAHAEVHAHARLPNAALCILLPSTHNPQATQSSPYWRADVELLIDSEEQREFEQLALQALESVQAGLEPGGSGSGSTGGSGKAAAGGSTSGGSSAGIPLAALMTAVPVAARAAAAASSAAWVDYELADAREECATGEEHGLPAVIDGSKPAEAQRMGRRLAAIAGNEVLPMPFYEQLLGAAQAAAAPGIRDVLPTSTEPATILQSAVDAQRPVLRQTAAAAYALATSAAAREIERLTGSGGGSGDSGGGGGGLSAEAATVAAARLNTAAERGVEVESATEVLGDGEREEWRKLGLVGGLCAGSASEDARWCPCCGGRPAAACPCKRFGVRHA